MYRILKNILKCIFGATVLCNFNLHHLPDTLFACFNSPLPSEFVCELFGYLLSELKLLSFPSEVYSSDAFLEDNHFLALTG